jgi:hypothetical protein
MKLEYFSNIKDGKLQKNISLQIKNDLGHFEGKRIHLTIEKQKSTRSGQQNRLYWFYVSIIANELGYSKDELHEIFKFKFLKQEKVDERTGEVFQFIGSTSRLSKTEFGEMIDALIQFAAETFSIILPTPNANDFQDEE